MFSSHPIQFPKHHTHQRHDTLGGCFQLFTGTVWGEQVLWGSFKTSPYNVEKVLSMSPLEEQRSAVLVLCVTEWSTRA